MGVFRDEKKIAELLEQIGEIESPVSGDLEERMISGLEKIAKKGDFIVHYTDTVDESVGDFVTVCDKTAREIYDAFLNGKNVFAIYAESDENNVIYRLSRADDNDEFVRLVFENSGSGSIALIIHDGREDGSPDTIYFYFYESIEEGTITKLENSICPIVTYSKNANDDFTFTIAAASPDVKSVSGLKTWIEQGGQVTARYKLNNEWIHFSLQSVKPVNANDQWIFTSLIPNSDGLLIRTITHAFTGSGNSSYIITYEEKTLSSAAE